MTSRTLSCSPSPSQPEDIPADGKSDGETDDTHQVSFGRCGSSEVDSNTAHAPSAPEERPAPLSPLASLQPPSRELRSHSRAMSSSATPT